MFTTERSTGRTAYNALCARCHGETLGGGETSPALVDDRFFQVWAGRTVGALVEYTRTTMPSDGPGRISRRRCIDIAAYLLSANGFPAGAHEFPTELDALPDHIPEPNDIQPARSPPPRPFFSPAPDVTHSRASHRSNGPNGGEQGNTSTRRSTQINPHRQVARIVCVEARQLRAHPDYTWHHGR